MNLSGALCAALGLAAVGCRDSPASPSADQSTSSVFVYNPQSNMWSTAASAPGGATAQGLGATTSHESFSVR